jgi:hypothetical protein
MMQNSRFQQQSRLPLHHLLRSLTALVRPRHPCRLYRVGGGCHADIDKSGRTFVTSWTGRNRASKLNTSSGRNWEQSASQLLGPRTRQHLSAWFVGNQRKTVTNIPICSLLSACLKNRTRLMKSPCYLCLYVYPPLSTLEWLNQSLGNLLCVSWHLNPSLWLTS